MTAPRASRRRVALVAAIAVAGAIAVLGASGFAAKRWARNRLPGLVLADPTPELAERYEFTGNAFVLGPFVTTVDPSAGSLAAQFQEGDSIESVEITDDGDTYFGMSRTVESVKGSIASEIAAGRTTVRLGVYRRRNQDRVLLVQLSRMERWLYLP